MQQLGLGAVSVSPCKKTVFPGVAAVRSTCNGRVLTSPLCTLLKLTCPDVIDVNPGVAADVVLERPEFSDVAVESSRRSRETCVIAVDVALERPAFPTL